MGFSANLLVRGDLRKAMARPGPGRKRRGSTLLMTLVYMIMFASLATSMVAFSQANMTVEQAENDATQSLIAAESGMSFLMLQFKTVGMPAIKEGNIKSMSTISTLWSGTNIESLTQPGTNNPSNNGIAVQLASAFNSSQALSSNMSAPSGTGDLNVPAIKVDSPNSKATFTLKVSWDSKNPIDEQVPIANTTPQQYTTYPGVVVLHCTSTGTSGTVSRAVTMDVWIQKTLKYAVYSNVAIQLGKNVRVVGDIASTYSGTGKGPPVQMFSDFHYLPNMGQMDNDLANLRGLLNTYDNSYTNRINTSNAAAVTAAAAQGLSDLNHDGYIDDYDVFLKNLDGNRDNQVTSGEFINPSTGKSYDSDLFTEIDDPEGPVVNGTLPNGSLPLWNGYGDNTINGLDGYAKVNGTIKMAIPYSSWQSSSSGWSDWGDQTGGTSGTNLRDQFEGPVINSDPTQAPVQFGVDFSSLQTLAPTNFDTSGIDSQIPSTTATKSGSSISNGTLSASMANGGTLTEHTPASATSGWQATYSRPVFQNINFTNVRIPKGLNAKFINCTFSGYTSVQMNTTIVSGGTVKSGGSISGGTTTTDPSAGMTYAERMISGSFSADTTLTSSNSVGYTQGNNLHFSGCTFNGPIAAAIPTAYTHFADSMEFDGVTNFNNTYDPTFTILAPQTNIEMGSFQNPGGNPSTLVGVVVAGNIDIRGSAIVDGSLIVTGNGATNTTLGYFGSSDSGQAVPPPSQLPSEANGAYGHLFFKINPSRSMPNGISIPVVATPEYGTYQLK